MAPLAEGVSESREKGREGGERFGARFTLPRGTQTYMCAIQRIFKCSSHSMLGTRDVTAADRGAKAAFGQTCIVNPVESSSMVSAETSTAPHFASEVGCTQPAFKIYSGANPSYGPIP